MSSTALQYYATDAGRRFLRAQLALLAGAAVLLLALFELTDLDRAITQLFFDAQRGEFALRNNWWLEQVMHRAARALSVLCALALAGMAISAWIAPQRYPKLAQQRAALTYLALALFAAPLFIGALKELSNRACPWDIAEFGGTQPYLRLFDRAPAGARVGACFPGAHAVSGLTWMALGLVIYPSNRALARAALLGAFLLGQILGFAQLMRGAHFLSHNLWSAWLVWALDLALLQAALRLVGARRQHR